MATRRIPFLLLALATAWSMIGCSPGGALTPTEPKDSVKMALISANNGVVGLLYDAADAAAVAQDHNLQLSALVPQLGLALFTGTAHLEALAVDPRLRAVQADNGVALSEPVDVVMGFHEGVFHESEYPVQDTLAPLTLTRVHTRGTGAGVRVAILDTGIDSSHPHLASAVGSTAIPFLLLNQETADGVDSDGDGKIDEAFGHGTHVAGIIHTIAPDATLIAYKVLDDDGVGTAFEISVALAAALFDGVDVANMSLSLSAEDAVVALLLDELERAGISIVAAAGNTGGLPTFPSTDSHVVGIAALSTGSQLATYSGRGGVPLAAPGNDVVSSYPGNDVARASGTSMASAVAAGCFALLRGDGLDHTRALARLRGTAGLVTPGGSVSYGAIQLARALIGPPPTKAIRPNPTEQRLR